MGRASTRGRRESGDTRSGLRPRRAGVASRCSRLRGGAAPPGAWNPAGTIGEPESAAALARHPARVPGTGLAKPRHGAWNTAWGAPRRGDDEAPTTRALASSPPKAGVAAGVPGSVAALRRPVPGTRPGPSCEPVSAVCPRTPSCAGSRHRPRQASARSLEHRVGRALDAGTRGADDTRSGLRPRRSRRRRRCSRLRGGAATPGAWNPAGTIVEPESASALARHPARVPGTGLAKPRHGAWNTAWGAPRRGDDEAPTTRALGFVPAEAGVAAGVPGSVAALRRPVPGTRPGPSSSRGLPSALARKPARVPGTGLAKPRHGAGNTAWGAPRRGDDAARRHVLWASSPPKPASPPVFPAPWRRCDARCLEPGRDHRRAGVCVCARTQTCAGSRHRPRQASARSREHRVRRAAPGRADTLRAEARSVTNGPVHGRRAPGTGLAKPRHGAGTPRAARLVAGTMRRRQAGAVASASGPRAWRRRVGFDARSLARYRAMATEPGSPCRQPPRASQAPCAATALR